MAQSRGEKVSHEPDGFSMLKKEKMGGKRESGAMKKYPGMKEEHHRAEKKHRK